MRPWLALALCALTACSGEPAAKVELVDLPGLEERMARSKGRPLVLNFWAIW